jgi:hypothetical protein
MASTNVYASLEQEIGRLRDAFLALRVTVVEDRPLDEGTLLVDALGDVAEELLAGAQEALVHARQGELSTCHEEYHRMQRRFAVDLVSYERIAEIARLGRSRGGEWKAWASSVRAGAEACRQPLEETGAALVACWREAAERSPEGIRKPAAPMNLHARSR